MYVYHIYTCSYVHVHVHVYKCSIEVRCILCADIQSETTEIDVDYSLEYIKSAVINYYRFLFSNQ